MKPTQAQIEAAAMAMEQKMFAPHELPLDDELHAKYLDTAVAALTAAAEGEKEQIKKLSGVRQMLAEERRVTIERCAQVAEEYSKVCQAMPTSVIDNVCRGIAAAIRALKNEP